MIRTRSSKPTLICRRKKARIPRDLSRSILSISISQDKKINTLLNNNRNLAKMLEECRSESRKKDKYILDLQKFLTVTLPTDKIVRSKISEIGNLLSAATHLINEIQGICSEADSTIIEHNASVVEVANSSKLLLMPSCKPKNIAQSMELSMITEKSLLSEQNSVLISDELQQEGDKDTSQVRNRSRSRSGSITLRQSKKKSSGRRSSARKSVVLGEKDGSSPQECLEVEAVETENATSNVDGNSVSSTPPLPLLSCKSTPLLPLPSCKSTPALPVPSCKPRNMSQDLRENQNNRVAENDPLLSASVPSSLPVFAATKTPEKDCNSVCQGLQDLPVEDKQLSSKLPIPPVTPPSKPIKEYSSSCSSVSEDTEHNGTVEAAAAAQKENNSNQSNRRTFVVPKAKQKNIRRVTFSVSKADSQDSTSSVENNATKSSPRSSKIPLLRDSVSKKQRKSVCATKPNTVQDANNKKREEPLSYIAVIPRSPPSSSQKQTERDPPVPSLPRLSSPLNCLPHCEPVPSFSPHVADEDVTCRIPVDMDVTTVLRESIVFDASKANATNEEQILKQLGREMVCADQATAISVENDIAMEENNKGNEQAVTASSKENEQPVAASKKENEQTVTVSSKGNEQGVSANNKENEQVVIESNKENELAVTESNKENEQGVSASNKENELAVTESTTTASGKRKSVKSAGEKTAARRSRKRIAGKQRKPKDDDAKEKSKSNDDAEMNRNSEAEDVYNFCLQSSETEDAVPLSTCKHKAKPASTEKSSAVKAKEETGSENEGVENQGENTRRRPLRERKGKMSFKEPSLHSKLRQGDPFTSSLEHSKIRSKSTSAERKDTQKKEESNPEVQ